MIESYLDHKPYDKNGYWVDVFQGSSTMCGSDDGYIFNDYTLFDSNLPVTIDHIINYVF